MLLKVIISISIFFIFHSVTAQTNYHQILDIAQKKYLAMLDSLSSYKDFPRSVKADTSLLLVKSNDWTSGFFPGVLWYLYEYSGDSTLKEKATLFTESLEGQKSNTSTHDLGFMIGCSYGNGYRLTGDTLYKNVIVTAAGSLGSRFNSTIGCIRSWDFGTWEFPVIIDNMMNLELMFNATKYTGDSSYYQKAAKHADKTLAHHFRTDHSSYHVVDYSKTTGEPISKETFQGYADESAWARGQAWGLYGYTMAYRETGIVDYLTQAKNIAGFFIENIPSDYVPFWDFDRAEIDGEPRDVSAAAIAASALAELSQYDYSSQMHYLETARLIVENLSSSAYLDTTTGSNGNFLLKHSTGNKPSSSEIDVPLVYADYYFIEALLRLKSIFIFPQPSITAVNLYRDIPPYP